jgi:hypothetical protein
MHAVRLATPLLGLLIIIGAPAALAKTETPDIRVDSDGLPKVKFKNGCVMEYDTRGVRVHKSNKCTKDQAKRADDAVGDYVERQKSGHGHADHHSDDGSPRIIMGKNNEGEVIFKDDCVVYYDAKGHRKNKNDKCSKSQASQADDAMARYRREQSSK